MKTNLKTLILLFAAAVSIAGCGGGNSGALVPSQSTGNGGGNLSRLSGGVFDTQGQPVAGATVVMNADQVAARGARVTASGISQASALTDENGGFSFEIESAPAEGTRIVLRLSRPGYIDTNAVIRLNYSSVEDGLLFVPFSMAQAPQDESSATQAEVTRTDGTTQVVTPQLVTDPDSGLTVARTTVTFDENVDEIMFYLPSPEDTNVSSVSFTIGGEASAGRTAARTLGYTGEVTGSLFYGDPTDEDALSVFPGEFVTSDDTGTGSAGRVAAAGGTEGTLVTAGFTQIKLEDSSGDEITSFADGVEVGVSMRVPDGIYNPETGTAVAEGDDVPIFTYDEDTGEWRVEHNDDGTVKRGTVMRDDDGLYVPFSTDHLSWFNLDWKGQLCEEGHPAVQAVDGADQQIKNFSVKTSGADLTAWRSRTETTFDGLVEFIRAPADIQWFVTIEAEGYRSDPVEINSCGDVTVTLSELNAVSETAISASCSGSPYAGVSVYAYSDGVRIGNGETDSSGTLSLNLPADTGVMIYGSSGDECSDLKSTQYTTGAPGVAGEAALSFNNACCPDYVAPLKISSLAPDKAESVDTGSSVAGSITFSKDTVATSVPDPSITLQQGSTTVFSGTAADTLGTVSWTDKDGDSARTLGFTIARSDHLQAGKTYSFTITMTKTQFAATDGGMLELDSYLTSVPGVVSYTSTSVTGTFTTEAGPENNLPVPDAGEDAAVIAGTQVALDGTGSYDPDGDALTYLWVLASGPAADITGADSPSATFTPSVAGTYIFALTVDDGRGGKMRDLVTITACESISCYSDDECDDGRSYTVDTCVGADTCDASCENEGTYCSITLDKVNYEPGEQMAVTFTSSNAGSVTEECGAIVILKKDNQTVAWFSFDDDVYISIPAGTRVEETSYYTVPEEWADTDSPAGSDYGIYPVKRDGTDWDNGDNFNIIIKKCAESACSADADCDDGLSYTTDACVNPGLCSAQCTHDCDAACLNDVDCDDGDPLTIDTCVDFISCDPAVACSNISIECNSDADCDDSDPLTSDSCSNPGTVDASCINSQCDIACSSGADCDDLDANTVDECNNPGTCEASCNNCIPSCDNDTQCDDGDPMTSDVCDSVGTCSAACSNTPCTPACNTAAGCDDGDPETADMCVNPSTCDSACTVAGHQTKIDGGISHFCAVDSSGGVKCWGENWSGQLGDGTTTDNSTPVSVTGITGAVAVSAGMEHSCAVISDGSVKCWGENWIGQLGDGTDVSSSSPVDVTGITNAVDVLAIGYSSCALLSNGGVKCWGYNSMGELGDGTNNDSYTPVDVTGITGATAISQHGEGDEFACAALYSGGVKCWGANWSGQLGNGTYNDANTPVDVTGITDAVSLGGDMDFMCAVLSGGRMKCWGYNSDGQLGDGTDMDSTIPVDVLGITDAIAVSSGYGYTCALLSGGGVKCWGYNEVGSLGNGGYTDSYTPVSVVGISDAVAIGSSDETTCAMLSGGNVKCWGRNMSGEFGNGTTIYSVVPSDVTGITDAVDIDSHGYFNCAALSGGDVNCWGQNAYSQLGDGTTLSSSLPVTASGVSGAEAVSVGLQFSCAAISGGDLLCWGRNSHGQLGDGTTANSTVPVNAGVATAAVDLDAGWYHMCAALSDGTVQCWGYNNNGQLGNGSLVSSSIPVDVTGVSGATQVASGKYHTCALMSGGGVQCWGDNNYGQLGNGMSMDSSTAVDVSGIADAVGIAAGWEHSCALLSGGGVQCWGLNTDGQLGNGSNTSLSTPADVTGITTAVAITAGAAHTCAVLSGGGMKCWGRNNYGMLGDGTTAGSNVPVDVSGMAGASSALAGSYHTCAMLSGGGVQCWGGNSNGELGDGSMIYSSTPVDSNF